MVIQITQKCFENCSHCMVSGHPKGAMMTDATFQNALKFIEYTRPFSVAVSGGEPTLHPKCFDMLDALDNRAMVSLLSNGSWYGDPEISDKVHRFLKNEFRVMQISTHKDFYPNFERTVSNWEDGIGKYPHSVFIKEWDANRHLKYLGRARELMDESEVKSLPSCSNCLSIARNYTRLPPHLGSGILRVLRFMESRGRFCVPFIDVDGEIRVGESQFCQSIGNVNDLERMSPEQFDDQIMRKLLQTKFCNRCKSVKNIDPEILNALALWERSEK